MGTPNKLKPKKSTLTTIVLFYHDRLSAFHTTKAYAKAFGDAHEKDFPGPEIENTMDLIILNANVKGGFL